MVVAGGMKVLSKKPGGGGRAAAVAGPGGGGPGGARGPRRRRRTAASAGRPMVSVAVAQPRTFEDTIEVLGVAKGRQSVTLSAAATQLIDRVRFVDGQHVKRGAVLVELRDTEQDAGTAQAQARMVVAQRAYERYRILGEKGFASGSQVDQYESVYKAAQADVAAAKARQADRIIRAPFAGVVGLSDIAPGALVNPGAPIVTLDDVSVVRVDFQVPERYLAQLRPGQTLLATADAFPARPSPGASPSWTAAWTSARARSPRGPNFPIPTAAEARHAGARRHLARPADQPSAAGDRLSRCRARARSSTSCTPSRGRPGTGRPAGRNAADRARGRAPGRSARRRGRAARAAGRWHRRAAPIVTGVRQQGTSRSSTACDPASASSPTA
jgi:hypothetical protein